MLRLHTFEQRGLQLCRPCDPAQKWRTPFASSLSDEIGSFALLVAAMERVTVRHAASG